MALLGEMPVADRALADRIRRAREIQEASAARSTYASGATPTSGEISDAAGALASGQGSAAVDQSKTMGQRRDAATDLATQRMASGAQNTAFNRSLSIAEEKRRNDSLLDVMSREAKQDIVDRQMAFARNENGRLVLNQRQAADQAALLARNAEELKDFQQASDQATNRYIQTLQIMRSRMEQELRNKTQAEIQEIEQRTGVDIAEMKRQVEQDIANKEAERQNKAMIWGAVGAAAFGTGALVASGGNPAVGASAAQAGNTIGAQASQL